MAECGKRVGKGVVTYPCEVESGHDGPCASPDNPSSQRARTAWQQARGRLLVDVLRDDPKATVDRLAEERVGYAPSPSAEEMLADAQALVESTKAADRGGQPKPVHVEGAPSMHDLLIAEIEKRKALGLSRYGTILQAGNGRDALQDMLDELIDACVYAMQLIAERDGVTE